MPHTPVSTWFRTIRQAFKPVPAADLGGQSGENWFHHIFATAGKTSITNITDG
jgi:hypothetical protein